MQQFEEYVEDTTLEIEKMKRYITIFKIYMNYSISC